MSHQTNNPTQREDVPKHKIRVPAVLGRPYFTTSLVLENPILHGPELRQFPFMEDKLSVDKGKNQCVLEWLQCPKNKAFDLSAADEEICTWLIVSNKVVKWNRLKQWFNKLGNTDGSITVTGYNNQQAIPNISRIQMSALTPDEGSKIFGRYCGK
ncbi:hypothetical protein P154DRAFT_529718 [Amniculicola lignicola CBS 123094]|uniref:Uncharacterized protein n=1 Tax=Amniculicola lignicola CBS 123094 TaxID=1392246 RepID=A0A6A5WY80_9PLEO|nr:hypothetical protein P154DRAFT_529718 [Amniculicola lignicola CBS 123094]